MTLSQLAPADLLAMATLLDQYQAARGDADAASPAGKPAAAPVLSVRGLWLASPKPTPLRPSRQVVRPAGASKESRSATR